METNALSALALILDGLSIPWVLIGAVAALMDRWLALAATK
jgi:hypothetical protein